MQRVCVRQKSVGEGVCGLCEGRVRVCVCVGGGGGGERRVQGEKLGVGLHLTGHKYILDFKTIWYNDSL